MKGGFQVSGSDGNHGKSNHDAADHRGIIVDDESLRKWTLDFTSRMRGSDEGQEGLSSFLEKRSADWIED